MYKWEDIKGNFYYGVNYFEYSIKQNGNCEILLNKQFYMTLEFSQGTIYDIKDNIIFNHHVQDYLKSIFVIKTSNIILKERFTLN